MHAFFFLVLFSMHFALAFEAHRLLEHCCSLCVEATAHLIWFLSHCLCLSNAVPAWNFAIRTLRLFLRWFWQFFAEPAVKLKTKTTRSFNAMLNHVSFNAFGDHFLANFSTKLPKTVILPFEFFLISQIELKSFVSAWKCLNKFTKSRKKSRNRL